jgi:hypothetical protein
MFRALWILLVIPAASLSAFSQEHGADLLILPSASAGPDGASSLAVPGQGSEAPWSASEPCELLCDDCAGFCAEEPPVTIRFGVPAWLPEMHGSAAVRGIEAPVSVSTRDLFKLVDDVNFAVAGQAEIESGRWRLLADGSYVNMRADRSFLDNRIDLSAGFEQAIVDTAFTYDVHEQLFGEGVPQDFSTEVLAGARYWLLGTDGITVTGPQGSSVTRSGTRDWVDPIIGGRVAAPLSDDLLVRVRADVGGFGVASDFTWNVEAVGEYRCSERCGLQFGYRVLDVDYSRGDGFAYDVNYRGPIATLMFTF